MKAIAFGSISVLLACRVYAGDCSPGKTNSDCTIVIDREAASAPLAIRVTSNSSVTVRVSKRPIEKIVFDAKFVDIASPDPLGVIFNTFVPALKAFLTTTKTADEKLQREAFEERVTTPPSEKQITARLNRMHGLQQTLRSDLEKLKADLDRVGQELRDFQQIKAGKWTVDSFAIRRRDIVCDIAAQPTQPSAADREMRCSQADAGVAIRTPPVGMVNALHQEMLDIGKDVAKLEATPTEDLQKTLNEVASDQAQLDDAIKSMQTAQAALLQAATVLRKMDPYKISVTDDQVYLASGQRVGRTATVAITAQDSVSNTTSALTTLTITWGSTNWEVSSGVLFSTLKNRTFQASPIIVNGTPQIDASGKPNTVLTETDSLPTVVPIFLGHYRLAETASGDRRFAFLLTGGVGINPYYTTADFAAGVSLAYRGFMFSPLVHWGRDQRLTNGLGVGDPLGSSPPSIPTERRWVGKLAIGLTYRLPI